MAQHTWAPGVLTASDMNAYIRDVLEGLATWQTYAVELTADATNPSLGTTGTAVGRWARLGNSVLWSAEFRAGGSGISAGTGLYRTTLPVAARATGAPLGFGQISGAAGVNPVTVDTNRGLAIPGGWATHTQGLTADGHWVLLGGSYEAA